MPFLAFLSTAQGRIAFWDTGEMQTAPWIFGIPHPTGFPAFVIVAGIFAHLVPIGTVAWRIALLCALLLTACVTLVYATIVRITGDRLSAACAGWLLAFGTFFWSYGDRAEIHTMAAFWAALALYCAVRGYYEDRAGAFVASAAACGMGLATHPVVLFLLPSLIVLALARVRAFSLRSAAAVLIAVLVPLLLYAYLPLRSHAIVAHHLDPAIALGKPPGAAIWNTDNPQSWPGFVRLVTGADFSAARSVLHAADVPLYADKLHVFAWTMYREFTPVGIIAGAIGFVILLRRRATLAASLLLAIALPSGFALAYPPVVEIERYFFIPMIAFALVIGFGMTALSPEYRNLLRIPVGVAAIVLLVVSYGDAHLRSVNGAEELIAAVRETTPSNAIVVADWTRGTALAYAAYVDRSLGDRRIDISWLAQDRRYIRRWMNRYPVYYAGRPVLHRGLLLCPRSADYPIYAVRVVPGQCN
ncbi:MAG TPA: DUF2723 domain-containing protein [Candidatus Baltobacteraceae bacterium]